MMLPKTGKTRAWKRLRNKQRRSQIQVEPNKRRVGKRRGLDGTLDGAFRSSRVNG